MTQCFSEEHYKTPVKWAISFFMQWPIAGTSSIVFSWPLTPSFILEGLEFWVSRSPRPAPPWLSCPHPNAATATETAAFTSPANGAHICPWILSSHHLQVNSLKQHFHQAFQPLLIYFPNKVHSPQPSF